MFKAVSASNVSLAFVQTKSGAGNMDLTGASVNDGSNMSTTVTLTTLHLTMLLFHSQLQELTRVEMLLTETIGTGPNAGTVTGSTKRF